MSGNIRAYVHPVIGAALKVRDFVLNIGAAFRDGARFITKPRQPHSYYRGATMGVWLGAGIALGGALLTKLIIA